MVVIKKCTCISKFQDKEYGKGNRLHNEGPKKIRCSVCGKETIK